MNKFIKVPSTVSSVDGLPINLRCPSCHRQATLDLLKNTHDFIVTTPGSSGGGPWVGYRVCPNLACRQLMVIVYRKVQGVVNAPPTIESSYPAERIDFDATEIPAKIVNALEEAITCHAAGCYVAAAIMVRKTLEGLCKDQKATGKRLIDQIRDLKTKVIVPTGLLDGIDNLRLLGNDAAHVELATFDQIGEEEVQIGILFTKELLKAVFQSSLLADRLNALKKP